MATYAIQFITRDGAFEGQRILNRARALLAVDTSWPAFSCVLIVVSANSQQERVKMRATAVAQVFHERVRAIDWLKQLGEENSNGILGNT